MAGLYLEKHYSRTQPTKQLKFCFHHAKKSNLEVRKKKKSCWKWKPKFPFAGTSRPSYSSRRSRNNRASHFFTTITAMPTFLTFEINCIFIWLLCCLALVACPVATWLIFSDTIRAFPQNAISAPYRDVRVTVTWAIPKHGRVYTLGNS